MRAHGELMADLPAQVQARWEPLGPSSAHGETERRPSDARSRRTAGSRRSTAASGTATPSARIAVAVASNGAPTDTELTVARFLVSDRDNPSSVVSAVVAARENLRTTRDTVPRDGWHVAQRPLPVRHDARPTAAPTAGSASASSAA